MSVALIVAVARNGVIGADGGLPWRLTSDLKRFKALTMGKTLVMGRATYDSIGRPLPGRRTVVLTRDPTWSAPGVTVAHDLASALAADGDVMVAGGAQIYALALPFAEEIHLSRVDAAPAGDTLFPAFDPEAWGVAERVALPAGPRDDHPHTYLRLVRPRGDRPAAPRFG